MVSPVGELAEPIRRRKRDQRAHSNAAYVTSPTRSRAALKPASGKAAMGKSPSNRSLAGVDVNREITIGSHLDSRRDTRGGSTATVDLPRIYLKKSRSPAVEESSRPEHSRQPMDTMQEVEQKARLMSGVLVNDDSASRFSALNKSVTSLKQRMIEETKHKQEEILKLYEKSRRSDKTKETIRTYAGDFLKKGRDSAKPLVNSKSRSRSPNPLRGLTKTESQGSLFHSVQELEANLADGNGMYTAGILRYVKDRISDIREQQLGHIISIYDKLQARIESYELRIDRLENENASMQIEVEHCQNRTTAVETNLLETFGDQMQK